MVTVNFYLPGTPSQPILIGNILVKLSYQGNVCLLTNDEPCHKVVGTAQKRQVKRQRLVPLWASSLALAIETSNGDISLVDNIFVYWSYNNRSTLKHNAQFKLYHMVILYDKKWTNMIIVKSNTCTIVIFVVNI